MTVIDDEKFQVSILEKLSKEQVIWRQDSILIYIENGKGIIRYRSGHDKDKNTKAFLLVDDVPITKWHADEYYCPTCEKLLSAGYGIDNVPIETLEIIRSVSNMKELSLDNLVSQVNPLLELQCVRKAHSL